jgi:hypothetical protein
VKTRVGDLSWLQVAHGFFSAGLSFRGNYSAKQRGGRQVLGLLFLYINGKFLLFPQTRTLLTLKLG